MRKYEWFSCSYDEKDGMLWWRCPAFAILLCTNTVAGSLQVSQQSTRTASPLPAKNLLSQSRATGWVREAAKKRPAAMSSTVTQAEGRVCTFARGVHQDTTRPSTSVHVLMTSEQNASIHSHLSFRSANCGCRKGDGSCEREAAASRESDGAIS